MIYRPDHRYYGLTWNHCSTTVLSWFDQSSALYIWSTLTIVKSVDVWMIFAGFWDGYDLGVTPRLRNSVLTDHPIEEGREQLFDSGAHRLQYFKKYFIITSCWSWLQVLQSCFKLRHLEWLFKITTFPVIFLWQNCRHALIPYLAPMMALIGLLLKLSKVLTTLFKWSDEWCFANVVNRALNADPSVQVPGFDLTLSSLVHTELI